MSSERLALICFLLLGVARNTRDFPPFRSLREKTPAERDAFTAEIDRLLGQGEPTGEPFDTADALESYLIGHALLSRGALEQAGEYFHRACDTDLLRFRATRDISQTIAETARALTESFRASGRMGGFLTDLEKHLAGGAPEWISVYGDACIAAGDYSRLESALSSLVGHADPAVSAEALLQRSRALSGLGRFEAALEDATSAVAFYSSLVGYTAERPTVDSHDEYRVLHRDGRPRAGVNELPWEEVQPNWLPYIRVADPSAVARRAEELGGRVLIAPDPAVRNGSAALLMDPTGAAFAIQRWPVEEAEGAAPGRGGVR